MAKTSKEFVIEIAKYIDSKDQSRGRKKDKKSKDDMDKDKSAQTSMHDKVKAATIKEKAKKDKKKDRKDKDDTLNAPALWLLIRQVNVRCNTDTLKTGSRLVNLLSVYNTTLGNQCS